jgi:hypothetical protein
VTGSVQLADIAATRNAGVQSTPNGGKPATSSAGASAAKGSGPGSGATAAPKVAPAPTIAALPPCLVVTPKVKPPATPAKVVSAALPCPPAPSVGSIARTADASSSQGEVQVGLVNPQAAGNGNAPPTAASPPELSQVSVPELLEVVADAIPQISDDNPGDGNVDIRIDVPLVDIQLRIGF